MDKEFAPYTESLELKQIGFDEPCFGWYDGEYKDIINYDRTRNSCGWLNDNSCSSPTFSQAFRWFREKHRIMCVIDFYNDGDIWEDTMYSVTISEFEHFKTHDTFVQYEYKTYEEAELDCLRKLIDLTKKILNEKRSRDNYG